MALGDLFSKKKTVQLEDIRTPEAQQLGKDYLARLTQAVGQYQPGADFGTTKVPLTDIEKQSLGYLTQYLGTDVTADPLYQAGRGEIESTLAGDVYDPTTGQYYKATRAGMERATEGAIEKARRGQAVRGAFRSTGALRQEGDILTESAIAEQKLLADLTERERERRLGTAATGMQIAEYEAGIPLTKTQYAQTYGALERQNEIANLEREYTKWRDQRAELMSAFTAAGTASNVGQPVYGKTSYEVKERTGLGQLVDIAAPIAGAFMGGGGTLKGMFTKAGATGAQVGGTLASLV